MTKSKRVRDVSQVVECLLSKHKVLSSIPTTASERERKRERERDRERMNLLNTERFDQLFKKIKISTRPSQLYSSQKKKKA
jgi:hypothetical protein